jgi:3-dehydroquinate dehydratase-2
MQKVLILNGPNLNMLGTREPEVYGSLNLADIQAICETKAGALNLVCEFVQSNDEAVLVAAVQQAVIENLPVIINPAAFTHYSYGLRDACAQHTAPMIEIHLSNPHKRESFRRNSVVSDVVDGTIAGFGANSYVLALEAIAEMIKTQ